MDERHDQPRRLLPPLHVRANGTLFKSREWSEGNLLLDAEGRYAMGALVTIDAVGLRTDRLKDVGIRGRVNWVADDGAAAIEFLHRDEQAALVLRQFFDGT
ncbi:MAG: hypothetical protein OXR84_05660 [Magnetovibrio sp.]|nr:hypothetical protein [Magnetovibrio sp.]